MIENTLVAFRIPVPMLDKIKAYYDETDQSVSQVLRRCAAQNFRSDADPRRGRTSVNLRRELSQMF